MIRIVIPPIRVDRNRIGLKTSGCLLGEEEDGSDFPTETSSVNAVLEGLHILKVWDIARDVSESRANRARGDPSRPLKNYNTQNQQPIDVDKSNTQRASHLSALGVSHSRSTIPQWQSDLTAQEAKPRVRAK